MVTVGARVTAPVHFGDAEPRTYTGTVVWVHPAGRFFVVEFAFERGRKFRESYFPEDALRQPAAASSLRGGRRKKKKS